MIYIEEMFLTRREKKGSTSPSIVRDDGKCISQDTFMEDITCYFNG